MSNRFYVNGVQIFGNNEMFDRTYKELEKQGGVRSIYHGKVI